MRAFPRLRGRGRPGLILVASLLALGTAAGDQVPPVGPVVCLSRDGRWGPCEETPAVGGESARGAEAQTESPEPSAAQREATQLAAILSALTPEERALLFSIPEPERRTLRQATAAVTERYRRTAALREGFAGEVSRLRLAESDLEGELATAEQESADLDQTLSDLRTKTAELKARRAAQGKRLKALRGELQRVSAAAAASHQEARAAQELYWAKASELYRHLGDPRDYMPAIEWEEARTERRVRRSAATEPRAAPAARAAATVPARAPLAARPMPARPARIAASVPELQRMLERWNRERQGSYRAQAEKTSLELETQAMRQTLEREARNTLLKSGERQALEAARNRLARELAWQSYAVRREGRQLAEIVGRAYEAAKEKAFWKLMTRSVGKLLGEPAGADRLAAHCVWVLRSYREMLDGTLPRAAELLGTGAAPEDQAEYERLSLLGQRKPEDWAREVFQIKRQDLPLEAGSDAAP